MPDPTVVADAQSAGSSPAVDASPAEPSDSLSALSETELHAWRTTGDLPSAAPDASPVTAPIADPPPATAVQDQPASTDATSERASAPAWDPALLKAETKKRFDELLAHNARERQRADRAEAQLTRPPQPAADARPAASSAAPTGPTPGPSALVKPDPEAFTYGTADPAYLEALTDFKVATATAKSKAEWDEGQRQLRARDEAGRVISAFEAKAAAARAKHPDFDAVALLAPTEIQPGSAADLWVLEDDAGAEILYHLQQPGNAVERKRILALGPRQQLKELVRLGDRLTADPAAARSTTAPPPPPTLSSRATPGDAVERALADDDTGAYIRAMNARDLALHKR